MTDRSTADGTCDPPGQQEVPGAEPVQENTAPPHLPGQSGHSHPHQDPQELHLHQGDLRHSPAARGSPPASSESMGPSIPGQRHHSDTHPEAVATESHQHQASSLLHGSIPSRRQQQPETQPSSSEAHHPASPSISHNPPASSSSVSAASHIPTEATSATPSSDGYKSSPQAINRDHLSSAASGEPPPASSGIATPTDTPHKHSKKSIRPFVHAVMAFEKGRKFSTGTSVHRKRQMSTLVEKEGHFGPALTVCHRSVSFPCHDRI